MEQRLWNSSTSGKKISLHLHLFEAKLSYDNKKKKSSTAQESAKAAVISLLVSISFTNTS